MEWSAEEDRNIRERAEKAKKHRDRYEAAIADRAWAGIPSDLTYDPATYQAAIQGPSAMWGVRADPAAMQAQHDALLGLQGAYAGMGQAGPQEIAALGAARQGLAGASRAALANPANAGAMNQLGSLGQEYGTVGSAVDRAAMDRAMALLQAQGNVAGGLRDQTFNQQASINQAQANIDMRNAGRRNQAAHDNAGALTAGSIYNAQAPGRQWEMQLGATDLRYGNTDRAQARADQHAAEQRAQQRQVVGGLTSGGTGALELAYSNLDDDEDKDR